MRKSPCGTDQKVASPEEIAWRKGWISNEELVALAVPLARSDRGKYLMRLQLDRDV